ncbi:MAG TPA: RAMP superfamily CRISPR-associated protein [Ktedonobacteraceae bacterium]|nr:RAMP superfamily CRISPR-associated protein [Ktedonobacteraceae bacterium]
MNPYDFARIDWNKPPQREMPVWHNRLTSTGTDPLYSGSIEVDVYVETPLFIADPRTAPTDPRRAAQSIKNKLGEYIIPGSSLKGMLRTVVETLGNGCMTLFDGSYERNSVNYRREVPVAFQKCDDNTNLCIACRTFGMLKERTRGVFLGKVNIGDAVVDKERLYTYDPIYTAVLVEPKPHHADFYLEKGGRHIAGRKYYFHHSQDKEPLTADRLILMGGRPANRYIRPLDIETRFHFRLDFTNLTKDEFGVLLLAVRLEDDMRHKIGYGKPLGLGSIELRPISMMLIDYSTRYTQTGAGHSKRTVKGDDVWNVIDGYIRDFSMTGLVHIAMEDLRRIWGWPPNPDVDYYYPSKRDWFDTDDSIGKRIVDTRNVPRQS